jgi:hypothetical protein
MLSADRLEVQTEELRRVLLGGARDKEEEDENVEMLMEEWLMKVFPSLHWSLLRFVQSSDCAVSCAECGLPLIFLS